MMDKPVPCPKCKNNFIIVSFEDVTIERFPTYPNIDEIHVKNWNCYCFECGYRVSGYLKSAEAIAAWNRRAGQEKGK